MFESGRCNPSPSPGTGFYKQQGLPLSRAGWSVHCSGALRAPEPISTSPNQARASCPVWGSLFVMNPRNTIFGCLVCEWRLSLSVSVPHFKPIIATNRGSPVAMTVFFLCWIRRSLSQALSLFLTLSEGGCRLKISRVTKTVWYAKLSYQLKTVLKKLIAALIIHKTVKNSLKSQFRHAQGFMV